MDENLHRKLLDNLFDGVYFVNADRVITYWNKGAERITGYMADEVLGRSCADNILRHINDQGCVLCETGCPLSATIKDGESREVDVYLHHKYGHRVPVTVRASPIVDDKGNYIGAVEVFSDRSSENRRLLSVEEATDKSLRDPLTNLGNREHAELALSACHHECAARGSSFGVLSISLDSFDGLVERYGSAVGDRAMLMAARTIRNCCREHDVVCRWEDTVFLVLAPHIGREGLEILAERIRAFVEQSWLDTREGQVRATVSVGGALSRRDESHEEVLARAVAYRLDQTKGNGNGVEVQ